MATRCVITISTSVTDGETRRSECAAIADLLHRFEQIIVSSSGKVVSGTINDRNGLPSCTYVYTPSAAV